MKLTSAQWVTLALAFVICHFVEPTEAFSSEPAATDAGGTVAVAAVTPLTADSVTSWRRHQPVSHPGPATSDPVSSPGAPPERAPRSLGGRRTPSETTAVSGGRQRPTVMLVNGDGGAHSLASPRPRQSSGSSPDRPASGSSSPLTGGRVGRSLLPARTVGPAHVLVGLARASDTPLHPPAPRLSASAFLVQFSEIGGRSTRVVETRGGSGEGGSVGRERPAQERRAQGQRQRGHDQRPDYDRNKYPDHGRPQPAILSGGRQRHLGTIEPARGAANLGAERPSGFVASDRDRRRGPGDSDGSGGGRADGARFPSRSGVDRLPAQRAASSVTVPAAVRPGNGRAPAGRQPGGRPHAAPVNSQRHHTQPAEHSQGYHYETPGQAREHYTETRDGETAGYRYETPEFVDGYNYQSPNQIQNYEYETLNNNPGYSYTAPEHFQKAITDLTAVNSNRKLTGGVIFTAPRAHNSGGDIGRPTSRPGAGTGVGVRPSYRDGSQAGPELPRNNPSSSAANESTPAGNIRPGDGRPSGGFGGAQEQTELSGQRHGVQGHLTEVRSLGDVTRKPGVPSVQLAAATPSGLGPAYASTSETIVVSPDSDGQTGGTRYHYHPPPGSEPGYENGPLYYPDSYGNDPSVAYSDSEYGNDPSFTADNRDRNGFTPGADSGSQNNFPSTADAGYSSPGPIDDGNQYDSRTAVDTGYHYDPPTNNEVGYQYKPPSDPCAQYGRSSATAAGCGYNPSDFGDSSVNDVAVPEYHRDHWHRPSAPEPPSSNPAAFEDDGWRPNSLRSSAGHVALREPRQPAINLSPSTARPDRQAPNLSTARPRLPGTADSHAAVPEFPLSDSDISDSPRGLMWPVLDVLERTMAARMVSAATVSEPDGVEVWHRGTARPQLRRARRRRRASSTDSAAMQRALAMVAALTGVPLPTARPSGVALETPESENVTSTEAPQTTESPPPAPSPLPLQPQPDVWPRPRRDHQQQTGSNVSSAADGAADSQQSGVSVLPAPHAVTYGDSSAEQEEQGAKMELDHTLDGVEMELDHTADGAVLWSSDSVGAAVSLLDQFPFEPSSILGEQENLDLEDIDLAFGGGFFSAQPDKKFPLQDIVIPDFYFVGEFDAKENLIDAGDAIEARSAKSDGV